MERNLVDVGFADDFEDFLVQPRAIVLDFGRDGDRVDDELFHDRAQDVEQPRYAGRERQVDDMAVGRQWVSGIDDQEFIGLPELRQQRADRRVQDAALLHGTVSFTSQANSQSISWSSL